MDLVFNRFPVHRGFEVSKETGIAIFKELQKQGFQEWQIPSAETWILKTDWQFKQKVLTVNDFYPTTEQLKGYDMFIHLDEHLEIIKQKEAELTRVWQIYRDNSVQDALKGEYSHLQKTARMHFPYIVELQSQNADLKREIENLKQKIQYYGAKYESN